MEEDLLKVEWKTKVCNSGESCWCRVIVPKEPLGDDLYVAGQGTLTKEVAEYLVKLHNSNL